MIKDFSCVEELMKRSVKVEKLSQQRQKLKIVLENQWAVKLYRQ